MNDIVTYEQRSHLSAADIRAQVNLVQQVMSAVMKQDVHYGVIPGVRKPSLWKPGAEQLCATFRIAPSYKIEDLSTPDCVRYRVTCVGTHQASGIVMGEGLGECSSQEEKYKWRKASSFREFDNTPEDQRRFKYGYDKFKKQEYEIRQVRVEPADVANTILKMAAKRAQVAMTLNVTAASDIFSQDLEDLPEGLRGADEAENEVIDQATGEISRPARPQRKSAKSTPAPASASAQSVAPTPAQSDAKVNAGGGAVDTPLTEAQQKILRKRLEGANKSEEQLRERFGADIVGLKGGQFNEIAAWIKT